MFLITGEAAEFRENFKTECVNSGNLSLVWCNMVWFGAVRSGEVW